MRPNDRKYLKSHEWCKKDGDVAAVGISDFAVDKDRQALQAVTLQHDTSLDRAVRTLPFAAGTAR